MEGGSTTMSTAYSSIDVFSTPLVLLDRELKKVTIGLAIRGKILVGRACTRTSTFTCLKTNGNHLCLNTNLGVRTNLTILIGRC